MSQTAREREGWRAASGSLRRRAAMQTWPPTASSALRRHARLERIRLGRSRRATIARWAAVGLVLLALAAVPLHRMPALRPGIDVTHLRASILRWGAWAPVGAVLIMTAHTFLPIPAEGIGIVNGAIFGFWGGLAVSWAGAMSSALLAFSIGRGLRRRTFRRGPLRRLLTYGESLVGQNVSLALVIRFIPLLPFGLFNVALGRASVSWPTFLWTTGVGVLPVSAALVAVGDGATATPYLLPWAVPALAGLLTAGIIVRSRIGGRQRDAVPPLHIVKPKMAEDATL